MVIRINDKQKLIGKIAHERLQAKVQSAFSKFGDNVKSVDLSVEDVNGPRGGVDMQCRMVVKLKKLSDVVIVAKKSSLSKAVSDAVKRGERNVLREIKKRSARSNSSAKPQFALNN